MGNTSIRVLAAVALTWGLAGCTNFTGADGLGVDDVEVPEDDGEVAVNPSENPAINSGLTCAYAPGPYGVDETQIVPVTHNWNGWVAGEAAPRIFNVSELYDCESSKEIHAIIFDTSQFG